MMDVIQAEIDRLIRRRGITISTDEYRNFFNGLERSMDVYLRRIADERMQAKVEDGEVVAEIK